MTWIFHGWDGGIAAKAFSATLRRTSRIQLRCSFEGSNPSQSQIKNRPRGRFFIWLGIVHEVRNLTRYGQTSYDPEMPERKHGENLA